MRKNLSFNGNNDSILYSCKERKFLSYEKDGDQLFEKYGGRHYYSSRSGLSGAGYVDTAPGEDDLIEFGVYRTDCNQISEKKSIYMHGETVIYGYAPHASHKGVQHQCPVVLTDDLTHVAFCNVSEVADTLQGWLSLECEEFSQIYYNFLGEEQSFQYFIYKSPKQKIRMMNPFRFLSLSSMKYCIDENSQELQLFHSKLHIIKIRDKFYHKNKFGFLDICWETNPANGPDGHVVEGWTKKGDRVWKRYGNMIQQFTIKYYDFREASTSSYDEYDNSEFNNLIDWYSI